MDWGFLSAYVLMQKPYAFLKNIMDIKIVINVRRYSCKNESKFICERNIHVTF